VLDFPTIENLEAQRYCKYIFNTIYDVNSVCFFVRLFDLNES